MKYFTELNLQIYDNLLTELNKLLNSNIVFWGRQNQICLNSIAGFENDFHKGAGSLMFDWKNSNVNLDNNISSINVPLKTEILNEADFNVLCNQFQGTVFENLYKMLDEIYVLGRVRLMNLEPKTCLSWHTDDTPRLHYPVLTQEECFLVIEDEIMHLPLNKWYMADTTKKHTAFNGSRSSRIHLVAEILRTK